MNIKNIVSQSEDITSAFRYVMQKQSDNTRISDTGVILKVNDNDTYDVQPLAIELYSTTTEIKQTLLPTYIQVPALQGTNYAIGDICLFIYTDNPYTTDESIVKRQVIAYNNKVFNLPFITTKRGQKHQLNNCIIIGRIGNIGSDNIK